MPARLAMRHSHPAGRFLWRNLPIAAIGLGLVCGVPSLKWLGPADPGAPESDQWYFKGNLLAGQNRLDEAIDAFENAQRLSPKNADVYFALGSIWSRKGEWREAEVSFADFVKRQPKDR